MFFFDKLGFSLVIPDVAKLRVQHLVYQRKIWFNNEKPGITIAKPGLTEKPGISIAKSGLTEKPWYNDLETWCHRKTCYITG